MFINDEIRDLAFLNPINYKLTFGEFKFFSSKIFRLVGGIDANEVSGDLFSNSLGDPGFLRVPIGSIQVL